MKSTQCVTFTPTIADVVRSSTNLTTTTACITEAMRCPRRRFLFYHHPTTRGHLQCRHLIPIVTRIMFTTGGMSTQLNNRITRSQACMPDRFRTTPFLLMKDIHLFPVRDLTTRINMSLDITPIPIPCLFLLLPRPAPSARRHIHTARGGQSFRHLDCLDLCRTAQIIPPRSLVVVVPLLPPISLPSINSMFPAVNRTNHSRLTHKSKMVATSVTPKDRMAWITLVNNSNLHPLNKPSKIRGTFKAIRDTGLGMRDTVDTDSDTLVNGRVMS